MTLDKFKDLIQEFLAIGYDLQERVEKLKQIPYDSRVVGHVKYDDEQCERLKSEINVWQRKAKESIILYFGKDDYHVTEFCEYIPDSWTGLNYKREFQRTVSLSLEYVEGFVKLLDEQAALVPVQPVQEIRKSKKVFISHSSADKAFADCILDLLKSVGLEDNQIFYSSSVPNGIPLGRGSIVDNLRNQFRENDLYVIMVHSPRYYKSVISMNEVGAAWVLGSLHCSFLTADCSYNDLRAVINSQEIVLKVDSEDSSERLGEFIDQIVDFFGLDPLSAPKLIKIVNRFIDDAGKIIIPAAETESCNYDQVIQLHQEPPAPDMFSFLEEDPKEPAQVRDAITLRDAIVELGPKLQYPINRWNLSECIRSCFGRVSDEDIESIIVALSKEELIDFKTFANDDFGADATYSFTPKGFHIYSKLK